MEPRKVHCQTNELELELNAAGELWKMKQNIRLVAITEQPRNWPISGRNEVSKSLGFQVNHMCGGTSQSKKSKWW